MSKSNKNLSTLIKNFSNFLNDDISSAIDELSKIKTDKNRQHIQKLVYANLIDRFDHFIDEVFLSSLANEHLKQEFLKNKENETVSLKDLYEIMMLEQAQFSERFNNEFNSFIRASILNKRHSAKIDKLVTIFGLDINLFKKSRVNESNGHILVTRAKHKSIPVSIIGYSDWLYCRRSAIVHGGGSPNISTHDHNNINTAYKVSCAKRVRINIGSIKNAKTFYTDFVTIALKK